MSDLLARAYAKKTRDDVQDSLDTLDQATSDANQATTNADNAATYATNQGDYAKQEADRLVNVDAAQFDSRVTNLEEEHTEQDQQTANLVHGTQVIQSDQSSPLKVEFYGNSLVNKLGRDGNFETDSDGDGVADGWEAQTVQVKQGLGLGTVSQFLIV